jgi:hypothetical protein
MEKVGIFSGPKKYITAIWYIFWPFGNVVAVLVVARKMWQPC